MSSEATSPPSLETQFQVLQALDFDWTLHLRGVWRDSSFDSPGIHQTLREEFTNRLAELPLRSTLDSPLGWIVLGQPGSGKTHWLSDCRAKAQSKGFWFVLVDMTDVREFWSTVLQGYLESLNRDWASGRTQLDLVLASFLDRFRVNVPVVDGLRYLANYSLPKLGEALGRLIPLTRKLFPAETARHQDVIRALFAQASVHSEIHAAGLNWLQGNPVDPQTHAALGFVRNPEEPHRIVEALSWMMSLGGFTVLALDQLDPIVSQLDPSARSQGIESTPEGLRAMAIIHEIAHGLGALRDTTRKTLTMVSCIDSTLTALKRHSVGSWLDRFETPRPMVSQIQSPDALDMIIPRVAKAAASVGWTPPYPSWPFRPEAFESARGLSPRELLKACEEHRRHCLAHRVITELEQFGSREISPQTDSENDSESLETHFQTWRAQAPLESMRGDGADEDWLGSLLVASCHGLAKEWEMPTGWDFMIDEFRGSKAAPALHARIRLIDHNQGDREEHFCYRFLEKDHALAFQARLRGVMAGSGIDKKLSFRHGVILRSSDLPTGQASQKLIDQFQEQGGIWHKPDADTLQTLYAAHRLAMEKPPREDAWLRTKKPISKLPCFQRLVKRLEALTRSTIPPHESVHTSSPESSKARTSESHKSLPFPTLPGSVNGSQLSTVGMPPTPAKDLSGTGSTATLQGENRSGEAVPLGVRKIGSREELVTLPVHLLEKHTMILAGAGSGKTVLLKRLVEEAALAGIPSIVLDTAGDLTALTESWPESPQGWWETDPARAVEFREKTEIITWTPGRESGNNLIFEPLPNLAEAASDPEELTMAIDAAVEALGSLALSGKGSTAEKKKGILARALRHFATTGGGTLEDFLAVLDPLPAEAGLGISREERMAKEMADTLKAKRETSPMLRGAGTGLDPAALFGDTHPRGSKVRISVISFLGLATMDLRQQFVYQLGLTLFGWIKRNPHPPNRCLRGLLVVDEARDFLPSGKTVPSKASLQLLASQARKYHLGMILATQMPKEVENRVIGNCATHFYGRASSPAAIQAIQELLQARGGHAEDIATLKAGQFHVYNSEAGMKQPLKIQVPMCLSNHRVMEESEILAKASEDRIAMQASG